LGIFVCPLLRRQTALGSGVGYLGCVLIHTGQKEHVSADKAVMTGYDVGYCGGVQVANVGPIVDIIDRRGDVELFCGVAHEGGLYTAGHGRADSADPPLENRTFSS
jgi:hypothetical protein